MRMENGPCCHESQRRNCEGGGPPEPRAGSLSHDRTYDRAGVGEQVNQGQSVVAVLRDVSIQSRGESLRRRLGCTRPKRDQRQTDIQSRDSLNHQECVTDGSDEVAKRCGTHDADPAIRDDASKQR